MEKAKDVAKGGWHPLGKDGQKESWRGDFKGINQVAGWGGKGNGPHGHARQAEEHQSRPLASLKDPETFGPPPKNVNYHGGAAVPDTITPDRRGLGAPLSQEEVRATQEEASQRRAAAEGTQKPAPPPVPYRVDTTGLRTSSLPKPPTRRNDHEEQASPVSANPTRKPKPSLPPRQQATSTLEPSSPPPSYTSATQQQPTSVGQLNKGALERLGSVGVSVPGLNIGRQPLTSSISQGEAGGQPTGRASGPVNGQKSTLNELHSRFSGLSTKPSMSETPSQGISFAQKQAALKTASSFRHDPSSVSLSEAKASAATASNFRARHGDQVAAGWKRNLTGNPAAIGQEAIPSADSPISEPQSTTEKKPPPLPPPKQANAGNPPGATPPPVPLSSKPTF